MDSPILLPEALFIRDFMLSLLPQSPSITEDKILRTYFTNLGTDRSTTLLFNQNIKKAFIHFTFDIEDNYERLETIGDEILDTSFVLYFQAKYPKFTSKELTLAKHRILQKDTMGTFGQLIGLEKYIKTGVNLKANLDIYEDIVEAIVGGLYKSMENDTRRFFILRICEKIIEYIIEKMKIAEKDLIEKDPITNVKEFIESISEPQNLFEEIDDNQVRLKIKNPLSNYGFLKDYKIVSDLNDYLIRNHGILAIGTGKYKGAQKIKAYEFAWNLIIDLIGQPRESLDLYLENLYFFIRQKKDFSGENEQYLIHLRKLYKDIELFYFKTVRSANNNYLMLIGENRIGKKIILHKISSTDEGIKDMKTRLLKSIV